MKTTKATTDKARAEAIKAAAKDYDLIHYARHQKAQQAAQAMHELRTGRKTPPQIWGQFD